MRNLPLLAGQRAQDVIRVLREAIEEVSVGGRPRCPYCGRGARCWRDSSLLHNGKNFGPVWVCSGYPACDAYVGCHAGTARPLGRLANADLRGLRRIAHSAIDPFWQNDTLRDPTLSPEEARETTYAWLAKRLGIHRTDCHIGLFDEDLCRRTIAACQKRLSKVRGIQDLPL